MKARIAVALSGGVDSAVAAARLVDAGQDVLAIHGKEWAGAWAGACPSNVDADAARSVAEFLNIPFHIVNCEAPYRREVFAELLDGLARGITPNPDVACNRVIKFGILAQEARHLGANVLATGHYARVRRINGVPTLYRARDDNKDQSYFLCELTEAQLALANFPLASSTKTEVRAEAKRRNLPVADREESMGLCFVGTEQFSAFVRPYLESKSGAIVNEDGAHLGTHTGAELFTIGQRRGLGLSGGPYYVATKDVRSQTVTVVRGANHPRLFSKSVTVSAMHWINQPERSPINVQVRFRHRQPLMRARIHPTTTGIRVDFIHPAWAATPGQVLTVYRGRRVLGGGAITNVHP